MKKSVLTLVLVLILANLSTAHAKKDRYDEEVEDLSGGASLQSTVSTHGRTLATLTNQVNAVVTQVQTVSGDVGKADRKNLDQDKLLKDSQLRLQTLEDKISLLSMQMQELKNEGLLKPTSAQRFEEFKSYSRAVEGINSKNYKKAITDLQAFQTSYKKSPYAVNAQYWVGEAYYLQADYEMAIAEFQKMLSKDTKSIKSAAALYKQGLSFYHLQSFDDAKTFFTKVIRTFPTSIEAVQSSSQIMRINSIMELREQEANERQQVESTY